MGIRILGLMVADFLLELEERRKQPGK